MANRLKNRKSEIEDDGFLKIVGTGCLIKIILAALGGTIAYFARQPDGGVLKYLAWTIIITITLVWLINFVMTLIDRFRK